MLHEAMRPENLAAVRVGVASHNLFDVAYGLVLAAEAQAGDRVQFEMLEGMANHQRRALFEEVAQHLLLYAPACRQEEFINAIGYLVRRLDENTGPGEFSAPRLQAASRQRRVAGARTRLSRSVRDRRFRCAAPHAGPARRTDSTEPRPEVTWRDFRNEPDTDWSLPQNGEWARQIVASLAARRRAMCRWSSTGEEIPEGRTRRDMPRSVAARRRRSARYAQANDADVERAVACAQARRGRLAPRALDERTADSRRGRAGTSQARGDLIGAALADGGKTLRRRRSRSFRGDRFRRVLPRSGAVLLRAAASRRDADAAWSWSSRRGIFPIAIPCGGVAAALAAGNTVILKPASDTVLIAWELCQCFWRAGVSRTRAAIRPLHRQRRGRARWSQHADVDAVILTGGTETALRMLAAKPEMHLFAETGGKNATIVTALSDRDQAIKNVLHSAFSHSGQKCSATSLLMLEAEVYDDPEFRACSATPCESLRVGSAWDLPTRVGPLIRPPIGDLERALKKLEPAKRGPCCRGNVDDNPHLWSPGVKWGVQPGSVTHCTEFFGPVLGVMRFTATRRSDRPGERHRLRPHLRPRKPRRPRDERSGARGIRAGNLYINRPTTGAIVLRQPFGGMGRSCVGPGIKAGGPNYVAQFMEFEERIHQCHRAPDRASAPCASARAHSRAGAAGARDGTTAGRDRELR